MAEEVAVSKETAGLVATVIGWGLSIFYQGRKIGRLEEQFSTMKKQVVEALEKVDALESHHEKDMKDLGNWFRTDSGGQKFMTFPDHDLICNRNSRSTTLALDQMTEAMKGLTAQITILGEQTSQLKIAVAVLQETHSNGRKP